MTPTAQPGRQDRLIALQVLRFVAAALVVHMHAVHLARLAAFGAAAESAFWPGDIGAAGVDMFFVLSGFVIALTGPLASPPPSGATFFWRRWSRVAPLFYLLSAPAIFVAARAGQADGPRLIATFLFWPAAGPRVVQPFITAGWTLAFEMVFYSAVAAVLIGGRPRRNLLVLLSLIAGVVSLRRFSGVPPLRILGNAIFLEFAAGMVLAWAAPGLRARSGRMGAALLAAGVGVLAVEAAVGVGDAMSWQGVLLDLDALWRVAVFGGPAVLVVAGAVICEPWATGRAAALFARLGDASYAIYLTQGLVLPWASRSLVAAGQGQRPLLCEVVMVLGAVTAGLLAHLVVERPLARMLRRLGGPGGRHPDGSRPEAGFTISTRNRKLM